MPRKADEEGTPGRMSTVENVLAERRLRRTGVLARSAACAGLARRTSEGGPHEGVSRIAGGTGSRSQIMIVATVMVPR